MNRNNRNGRNNRVAYVSVSKANSATLVAMHRIATAPKPS